MSNYITKSNWIQVELVADKDSYFDAFMLQARGQDSADGNATFVGQWIKKPKVAKYINCFSHRRSGIVDIGA